MAWPLAANDMADNCGRAARSEFEGAALFSSFSCYRQGLAVGGDEKLLAMGDRGRPLADHWSFNNNLPDGWRAVLPVPQYANSALGKAQWDRTSLGVIFEAMFEVLPSDQRVGGRPPRAPLTL